MPHSFFPLPFPMDFDNAWCPVCDKQIQPKRFTVSVPLQHKQGLVNGTGRLKHLKQQQQQQHTRKRTVIDQGPIPLYCSDECQLADLSATRSGPPLDPAREEPTPTTAPIKHTDDSSIAKLAKLYNFPPLPSPPPPFDDSEPPIQPCRDYNSGLIMAGRLISSLCPPPAKPQVGPHRAPVEERKPVPGWTDGSNAWRASVYSFSSHPQSPFYPEESKNAYGSFTASPHRATRLSGSALSSPPPPPSQRSSSDQMIAKFSQSFKRKSEPRASYYPSTPTPASPTSTQSTSHSPPKRERALLPPGLEGKLLVPNVKLRIHSSSSASLSSAWSGPTSTSSARSPLSTTSDSDEEKSIESTSLPGYSKRPTVESESLFFFIYFQYLHLHSTVMVL